VTGVHATRIGNTRGKRIAVIALAIAPLAVLALLCWWMYYALREPPAMSGPARGAGAGHTGMSNEYMGLGKDRPAPAGATGATSRPK
jgi:hypothetical protein